VRVFVCPSRDEIGKFQGIVEAFPEIWEGLVLDVGCRSAHLQRVLPNSKVRYFGLDLFAPAYIVGNLEKGLCFQDESFDLVVALDILEHTDNIYKAFSELCRVSRKYVLITLPNAYEVSTRIKFLMGRPISGKYGLPVEPPDDRHRWLFSLREAQIFTRALGERHGFEVTEGCLVGPRRSLVLGHTLLRLWSNLLSPWYLALLCRGKPTEL